MLTLSYQILDPQGISWECARIPVSLVEYHPEEANKSVSSLAWYRRDGMEHVQKSYECADEEGTRCAVYRW